MIKQWLERHPYTSNTLRIKDIFILTVNSHGDFYIDFKLFNYSIWYSSSSTIWSNNALLKNYNKCIWGYSCFSISKINEEDRNITKKFCKRFK